MVYNVCISKLRQTLLFHLVTTPNLSSYTSYLSDTFPVKTTCSQKQKEIKMSYMGTWTSFE